MKIFYLLAILSIANVTAAGDGTESVLVAATETETVASPAVVVDTTACCETAKLAKLPPWQVRRLNRVADRQEARDARKCCDPCACGKEDACITRAVVVEARR
jgi:hypothetical protein